MRTIGKGVSSGNVLCTLLDLPLPPQKFEGCNKVIFQAVEQCAYQNMTEAIEEAVSLNEDETSKRDLTVCPGQICLDGSWQKRGHQSLNGFVSVTSLDTGKVLDVSIMSKYCQVCTVFQNKKETPPSIPVPKTM